MNTLSWQNYSHLRPRQPSEFIWISSWIRLLLEAFPFLFISLSRFVFSFVHYKRCDMQGIVGDYRYTSLKVQAKSIVRRRTTRNGNQRLRAYLPPKWQARIIRAIFRGARPHTWRIMEIGRISLLFLCGRPVSFIFCFIFLFFLFFRMGRASFALSPAQTPTTLEYYNEPACCIIQKQSDLSRSKISVRASASACDFLSVVFQCHEISGHLRRWFIAFLWRLTK